MVQLLDLESPPVLIHTAALEGVKNVDVAEHEPQWAPAAMLQKLVRATGH